MKYSKFERAKKVDSKLKELDHEIIQIEKKLDYSLKHGLTISLEVKKSKEEKKEPVLDSEGSLIQENYNGFINPFAFTWGGAPAAKVNDKDITSLDECESVAVLNALLKTKLMKRDCLVKEMQDLGLTE